MLKGLATVIEASMAWLSCMVWIIAVIALMKFTVNVWDFFF